ncbi:MAG: short-chain dehydrogenase [Melioribacteraceae bacterium]|nr:MAG: short-chain dehydrogenase [Melioribacteraceae bacterium]
MKDTITRYGKWVLITGASSGIGEEYARQFAAKGHNLVLIARREDRLVSLSDQLISKYNIEIKIIPLDLTRTDFIEVIKNELGDIIISILINNAGFGLNGEAVNLSQSEQQNMVMLNCYAPVVLTNQFLPHMKQEGRGAIIFLGSVVGFQPVPYMSLYSATKAFNLIYGEALWYELRKEGVDILAVNPGATKTEFQRIANIESGPSVRTAKDVVNSTFNALGRKPSVVDGYLNKISTFSIRFLSRKVVANLWGYIANKIRTR